MNIGDKVKVTDQGLRYFLYNEWLDKYAPQYKKIWNKDNGIIQGKTYRVLAKGNHNNYSDFILYLIGNDNEAILISENGIALEEKKYILYDKTEGEYYFLEDNPTTKEDILNNLEDDGHEFQIVELGKHIPIKREVRWVLDEI